MVFGCCFEGSQKDFRGCTAQGEVWVANISHIFDGLVLPLKVVKIKHPFGSFGPLNPSKQDPNTTGFDWIFSFKTSFAGTA